VTAHAICVLVRPVVQMQGSPIVSIVVAMERALRTALTRDAPVQNVIVIQAMVDHFVT